MIPERSFTLIAAQGFHEAAYAETTGRMDAVVGSLVEKGKGNWVPSLPQCHEMWSLAVESESWLFAVSLLVFSHSAVGVFTFCCCCITSPQNCPGAIH